MRSAAAVAALTARRVPGDPHAAEGTDSVTRQVGAELGTGQMISRGERPPVCCPGCGDGAECVDAKVMYPFAATESKHARWFRCRRCKLSAPAGANGLPLGTMADAILWSMRDQVRDMLISIAHKKAERDGITLRDAAAAGAEWLGNQIGTKGPFAAGTATVDECRAAIALLEKYVRRPV